MTIVYIYIALASYNTGYLTLPMNSIENIVDEAANIAVIDGKGRRRVGGSEKMKMKPGAVTTVQMANNNNHYNYNGSSYGYGYGYSNNNNNNSSNNYYYPAAGGSGNNTNHMNAGPNRRGNLNWKEIWNEGTDAVMDIPVGGVCEILYGQGRERDPEEEGEAEDENETEELAQSESEIFVSSSASSNVRHGEGGGGLRATTQGMMRLVT
jgi:phosphatidylinositol glycan class P protein